MVKFFLILVSLGFISVSFLSARFSNPYTLTYIFGLKGAGKSTYMASLMLRDLRRGWKVYTNMADVAIPGVRIMDSAQLTNRIPAPHSAVYIDEAGLVWDNRAFAKFDAGYVEYFKLQRKYRNKVVMNSQALDVDKKIRDLIDRMVMVTNLFGCVGLIRPIRRTIAILEAQGNAESRLALNLKFEGVTAIRFLWLPKYWRWFDSFQAPERPPALYREVPGELPPPPAKALLRRLRRSFSSKSD